MKGGWHPIPGVPSTQDLPSPKWPSKFAYVCKMNARLTRICTIAASQPTNDPTLSVSIHKEGEPGQSTCLHGILMHLQAGPVLCGKKKPGKRRLSQTVNVPLWDTTAPCRCSTLWQKQASLKVPKMREPSRVKGRKFMKGPGKPRSYAYVSPSA
eukprot:scaffold40194_cov17-Tisochrysis_lutea.AAC.1